MSKDRELLERLFSLVEKQAGETIEEVREHLFPKPKPKFEYALESLPKGTLVWYWDYNRQEAPVSLSEGVSSNEDHPFLAGPCNWKHIKPHGHPWIAFKPNEQNDRAPPVHSEQMVEVAFRRISTHGRGKAGSYSWTWSDHAADIVAYRIATNY
jgi:hypothetical protein